MSQPHRRYRCRFCGAKLPAWLPAAKRPTAPCSSGPCPSTTATGWERTRRACTGTRTSAVAFLGEHLLAVAILGGGLLILTLIWLPKWQAARPDLTTKERFEAENDARKTLGEIIGGAAVLVGLFFAWQNLKTTQEATKTAQESTAKNLEIAQETLKNSQAGQIADCFTKAIEQLGAVKDNGEKQLEVRLGVIYALEQIARVSKEHHWPIMEILTAYVREHAPGPPKPPQHIPPQQDNPTPEGDPAATQGNPSPKPTTDLQAVLTVLGRRDRTTETAGQRLNLRATDLRGAALRDARLEEAGLTDACLEKALLRGARLERANLTGARLERATLLDTDLKGAGLWGAHLQGAKNLTVEQLCTVYTLYQAQLDPPLTEQIRQQCPQFLEKP